MGLLRHAAGECQPGRDCLYLLEINNKNFEIVTIMLSVNTIILNGMKTARFTHFSIIAVCDLRISFSSTLKFGISNGNKRKRYVRAADLSGK